MNCIKKLFNSKKEDVKIKEYPIPTHLKNILYLSQPHPHTIFPEIS